MHMGGRLNCRCVVGVVRESEGNVEISWASCEVRGERGGWRCCKAVLQAMAASFDQSLPIQSPRTGIFPAAVLEWSVIGIAHIPFHRLQNFVDGEGRGVNDLETSFWIRRSDYKPGPRTKWMSKRTYWCAFGPQDVPSCKPAIPPMKGTFPKSGPNSRPRAHKSDYNNHQKRGCQCHFIVTQFKADPEVAVIQYMNRNHTNTSGKPCHGIIAPGEVVPWSIKNQIAPRLSEELKKTLMDLLRGHWSVAEIFDMHCVNQCNREGDDLVDNSITTTAPCTFDGRDDLLDKRDLYNLRAKAEVDKGVVNHPNDQKSVEIWVQKYRERVLLHNQYHIGPPAAEFILALQSPWQLGLMIEFSHKRALAMDSTFATNKYMFPFFTLVAFDHHQMGLPVAWSIQQRETADQICMFLLAVKTRALEIKADWEPSCFIIDCADAEVKALESVFPNILIYFCSWHVRRAWKENLVKKVSSRPKMLEMNDDLAGIMYAESDDEMWGRWKAFTEEYPDENKFIKYFEEEWLVRPEKWMRAVRSMARANQNTNGATEAWHLTLKKMIKRKLGDIGGLRMDKLVDMLFTYMLPFFVYSSKLKQLGRVPNYRVEDVVLSSLHLAECELKNAKVSFPDPLKPDRAVVQSVNTAAKEYVVRNIYSKFCSCDCKWADEGNMCKHQVKALLVRGHEGGDIAQQLGTRFGSQFGGMAPSNESIQDPNVVEHLLAMEEEFAALELHDSTHSPEALLDLPAMLDLLPGALEDMTLFTEICEEEAMQGLPVIEDVCPIQPLGDEGEILQPEDNAMDCVAVLHSIPEVTGDRRLDDAIAEMKSLATRSEHLYESALLTFTRGLHELKVQEQRQITTGKDVPSTNDKFVRPPGLTKKRRLGVVDIYHGAKRGKKVSAHLPKKKFGLRKKKARKTQGTTDTQDHQVTNVVEKGAEKMPDKYPDMRKVQRETFREELNRRSQAAVTGKSTRRTAKNSQLKLPLDPMQNRNPHGLGQERLVLGEVDLNQPQE